MKERLITTALIATTAFLMFDHSNLNAQTMFWSRQAGTSAIDLCNDVAVDPSDGGVVIVGRTEGSMVTGVQFGGSDIFVRKYSANGMIMWTRQFGTNTYDAATAVTAANGFVYVTGDTAGDLFGPNEGSFDTFFLRLRGTDGATQVTAQYGTDAEDRSTDIDVAPAGFVFLTGYTEGGPNAGGLDAWVARHGNPVIYHQFGTSGDDICTSVTANGNQNITLAGKTEGDLFDTNQGGEDLFVANININPNNVTLQWSHQDGSSANDTANDLIAYQDAILVTGSTQGNFAGQSAGDGDVLFLGMDLSDGDVFLQKQLGTPQEDSGLAITVDNNGDVYIVGGTDGDFGFNMANAGDRDIYLMKTAPFLSQVQYIYQIGSADTDVGQGVAALDSANIFLAGSTDGQLAGLDGFFDPYVARLVEVLLGDVNQDNQVNLLDVAPFVDLLSNNGYQLEADINEDGAVNLLDVAPFIDLLSGN